MKKILILCTGNSCRSIMAEAMINARFDDIEAYSSGVKASGVVNPNVVELLKSKNEWRDTYHSKTIDKVLDMEFDLVVTVCDNAKENCPIFPKQTKVLHVGFDDPSGKEKSEYEKTYNLMQQKLINQIKGYL